MTTTEARMRSKKAAEEANKKKAPLRRGIRIRVEDIRIGDRMVTSWHDPLKVRPTLDQAIDSLMSTTPDNSGRFVNRSRKIEKINECPGKWRTHVHFNGNECWDLRSYIWVVE